MVIVPKGHELEGRESVRLKEIAAYPQVGLQEGSSLQARLLAEAERLGVPLRLRVHVFGFDGVRGMVAAGLGVAVLPEGAVVPYLALTSAYRPCVWTSPGRFAPSWLAAATSLRFRSRHGNSSSASHRHCLPA